MLEIWTARVVYAGMGTPLLEGGIAVSHGHIAAVGPLAELRRVFPEHQVVDRGEVLAPRPVNAHTHLDLSTAGQFRGSYPQFIRHIIASRGLRTVEAARQGMAQLVAARVGAFGDIVYAPEVMDYLLHESPLAGVAYFEVLGTDPTQAEQIFRTTVERIAAWRRQEGRVRVGLSPHAAHTVSAPLLQKLVGYARLEGLPLQIHLAESPHEVEYLQQGTGELAALMAAVQPPGWHPPGQSPVAYLHRLGVLGPHLTIVHGVQVSASDLDLLAQSGTRVVACLRSNQRLDCGEFPWSQYLARGIEVALGTDSLASSPSLEVRHEAQALSTPLDPRVWVRALTRSGYRVLGLPTPRLLRGLPVQEVESW